MAYLETQIATSSAAPVEAPERDYYEDGFRITRDGVPCRVFVKRDKELSAQIRAIEIARDAGAQVELDDAPTFAFMPSANDEENIYKAKGAKPVPPKPTKGAGKDYYSTGKRYIIGGIPCRVAFAKLNHSFRHWADGERSAKQLADWKERAADWLGAWEAGEPVEGYERAGAFKPSQASVEAVEGIETPSPIDAPQMPLEAPVEPLDAVEVVEAVDAMETPLEALETPVEPVEAIDAIEGTETPLESPVEASTARSLAASSWEAVYIGDATWIVRSGRAWLGHDGGFVFLDSLDEAERIADALNRELDCADAPPIEASRVRLVRRRVWIGSRDTGRIDVAALVAKNAGGLDSVKALGPSP